MSYRRFILAFMPFVFAFTYTLGQGVGTVEVLWLDLPAKYTWDSSFTRNDDRWSGLKHSAYLDSTDKYPCFEINESLLQDALSYDMHGMAEDIYELVRNYVPGLQLKLIRKGKVEGKRARMYSIAGANQDSKEPTLVLFFCEGKSVAMHCLEMELHNDMLGEISLEEWEAVFFGARLKQEEIPEDI